MRLLNTVLVTAVALQRMVELFVSRRHVAHWRQAGVAPAADRVFPAMVALQVLLIGGSLLEPWLLRRPFLPAIGFPALALFLLAQAGRLWVLRTLGRHWNVRILPTVPHEVVSHGPYRFVRHPNYLVVAVEALTLPLVHSAWITWVLVQAMHTPVLLRRIRDEDRVLLANPTYRQALGDRPALFPWRGRAPR